MEIIVFILKLTDSDHSKRRIILSKKQQIPIVTLTTLLGIYSQILLLLLFIIDGC